MTVFCGTVVLFRDNTSRHASSAFERAKSWRMRVFRLASSSVQLAARKLKEAQMAALQRGSKRKQGSGRQKKKVKRKQSKVYE